MTTQLYQIPNKERIIDSIYYQLSYFEIDDFTFTESVMDYVTDQIIGLRQLEEVEQLEEKPGNDYS